MPWVPTIYTLVGFGATVISLLVAGFAWKRRHEQTARAFIILIGALAGWSLAYAIQLGHTTMGGQLLWQRVALAIGGMIPTLWLVFTLRYAGWTDWLTTRREYLLALDPLIFALLTLTNPYHGLIWDGVSFTPEASPAVVVLSLGIGYYIHIAYAYLLITAGIGLLFDVIVKSFRIYRHQTGLLILGAAAPAISHIGFTLQIPWGPLPALDPTPFIFAMTSALAGLALYRFDLLQRTPIARQQISNEMGDGVIVLDDNGRIVTIDSIAKQVLTGQLGVGDLITDGGFIDADSVEEATSRLSEQPITTTIGGRKRVFDVKWLSLTDHRGQTVGYTVAMRDVTDRHAYEQRLEVAQRVLRHNLRNDMMIVRGWAEDLLESATDEQSESLQRIIATSDGLIDLSEKIQSLVRIEQSTSSDRRPVRVRESVAKVVDEIRRRYPDATIEQHFAADATVALPDEGFLEIPIRNLIENALRHSSNDTAWASITTETNDHNIRIRILDRNSEIPSMEREVLQEGREKPLHHGSGLGLWLTHWCVTAVNGELTFESPEEGGNAVTLTYRSAGSSNHDVHTEV